MCIATIYFLNFDAPHIEPHLVMPGHIFYNMFHIVPVQAVPKFFQLIIPIIHSKLVLLLLLLFLFIFLKFL